MTSRISTKERALLQAIQSVSGDMVALRALLKDLLTPAEYEEVVQRLQIVQRLADGEPQRKIAKELGVGVATITRGSRALWRHKGGFYQLFAKKGG